MHSVREESPDDYRRRDLDVEWWVLLILLLED